MYNRNNNSQTHQRNIEILSALSHEKTKCLQPSVQNTQTRPHTHFLKGERSNNWAAAHTQSLDHAHYYNHLSLTVSKKKNFKGMAYVHGPIRENGRHCYLEWEGQSEHNVL